MEKIKKLKEILKKEGVDGYIIPKNDEFFSEYIPDYNDRLNFITGFTGSYGFALILKNRNYLFVDGRYTLQAHNQCGKIFKKIRNYQLLMIQNYLLKKYLKFFLVKIIVNLSHLIKI